MDNIVINFLLKISDQKKILLSFFSSLLMTLFFLIKFPISPYTDLIALINLVFASNTLHPYYQFSLSPTYMGFQIMVTIIQYFFGNNLIFSCIFFTYFMFLFLLISQYFFSSFLKNNNYYLFCIISPITFLLMNTSLFVTGTFPFIISSWIAIIALFLYLKYFILSEDTNNSSFIKYIILSISLAFFSGFMHPIGIELYLLGMIFFVFLHLFNKKQEIKRYLLLLMPIILLSVYNYISLNYYKQISQDIFQISNIFNFDITERIFWIYNGGGYNTAYLFPERINVIEQFITNFLGFLPFICLIFLIIVFLSGKNQEKGIKTVLLFMIYMEFLTCLGILILSDSIGSLCIVRTRLYALATPFILFTIYHFLNMIKFKNTNFFLIIGPFLMFIILISFIPVYSASQEIIPFSNDLSDTLYQNITDIRSHLSDREREFPIILTVDMGKFGTGYHLYMIVPFIMANEKRLVNENIIILCPWVADESKSSRKYIDFNYIRKIDHLNFHWNATSYPKMNITKLD